jgi:Transposase IS4
MVCADSYFASVAAAEELYKHNIRLIGVVKTATRSFPKQYLLTVELRGKGDYHGIVSKVENGKPALIVFVYCDRDRRYFIASGSHIGLGELITRYRWRQVVDDEYADPEKVEVVLPQPLASQLYYDAAATIDHHNRDRQAFLCLEKKVKTLDWACRLNLLLLAICIVDAWYIYRAMTHGNGNNDVGDSDGDGIEANQKAFYSMLAEQLINNDQFLNRLRGPTRKRKRGYVGSNNANGVTEVTVKVAAPRSGDTDICVVTVLPYVI